MKCKNVMLACCLSFLILLLSGCCMSHEWKEATCMAPRTCTNCGETEGSLLAHQWKEATCTKPKTCSVCGKTDGDSRGHTSGEWEVVMDATPSKDGKKEMHCTECGAVCGSKTFTLESTSILYDTDGKRYRTEDFAGVVLYCIKDTRDLFGDKIYYEHMSDSTTKGYAIHREGSDAWTMMTFTQNGDVASGSDAFDQIMFLSYVSTQEEYNDFMYNICSALWYIDPYLESFNDAVDLVGDIEDEASSKAVTKTIHGNKLTYFEMMSGSELIMTFAIGVGK